jgi:predicted nuclease of predicted toxin-antitoxin system
MPDTPGLFIQLYTDEDITTVLAVALRQQGYIAQSAVEAGMKGREDEDQLIYATSHNMAMLVFNGDDFSAVSQRWADAGREHAGIIVSEQLGRNQVGELLRRVLRLLNSRTADEMKNIFLYLSQYR